MNNDIKTIQDYLPYQPILNIGCLGNVSEGKTTLIKQLSGVITQRHSNELERNITIKQGYGNMKIWRTINDQYYTTKSIVEAHESNDTLVNHISFVDCPGHQDLLITLLNSISIMDGVIFVIAVNQPISKKIQLIQQLIATKLNNITKYIFCLNKIDLVSPTTLVTRKQELDKILKKYDIKPFAIIPTCFNKHINMDALVNAIMILFEPSTYIAKSNDQPIFRITRSFDVNKPGILLKDIVGGVLGGSLVSGNLKIGDKIKIQPGYNNIKYKDICGVIETEIISLKSEDKYLDSIISGGLIGIGTTLDPIYCKNDILKENLCLSVNNTSHKIYNNMKIKYNIPTFIENIWKPATNELIIIQIANITRLCKLLSYNNNNIIEVELKQSICTSVNSNVILLSKKNNIEIIGIGIIIDL